MKLLLPYTYFFGIDYSASKEAHKKIWITESILKNSKLYITNLYSLNEVSSKFTLEDCNSYLVNMVLNSKGGIFGFDFSFSIPEIFIGESTWNEFIISFSERWPSPQIFRNDLKTKFPGKEIKRTTEIESKVPFSSYNLWIYKQTYYGINNIINPLLITKKINFLPFDGINLKKINLIESCPASFLKRISTNKDLSKHYKGTEEKHLKNRIELLDLLSRSYSFKFEKKEFIQKITQNTEGDAIDSLICCLSSFKSISELDSNIMKKINQKEGYIF
jgi:hypothetical protein